MGGAVAREALEVFVGGFEGLEGEVGEVAFAEGDVFDVVELFAAFDALAFEFTLPGEGFELGGALDEPGAFDDALDLDEFEGVAGREGGHERVAVLGEDFGVFVVHQTEGAGGETVFGGIACGAGEAFRGFRAGAEAAVGGVVVAVNRVVGSVRVNHTT